MVSDFRTAEPLATQIQLWGLTHGKVLDDRIQLRCRVIWKDVVDVFRKDCTGEFFHVSREFGLTYMFSSTGPRPAPYNPDTT